MAAQKRAYEELVVAYKAQLAQYSEKCDELRRVRQELSKANRKLAETAPAQPVIEAEGAAALQERMDKLAAENEGLKSELKLFVEARDRNEAKQKGWYDEELKKKDSYGQQLVDRIQALTNSIGMSEKFYQQFAAHSAQLVDEIAKMGERRNETVVTATFGYPNLGETETRVVTAMKTIVKLEREVLAGKSALEFKEQELGRMSEEMKLLQEKAGYYFGWVQELQKQATAADEERAKTIQLVKDAAQRNLDLANSKAREEQKRLADELLQARTELSIIVEGEKRCKEQNEQLKGELQKLLELFDALRAKLIETSTSQYVYDPLWHQNRLWSKRRWRGARNPRPNCSSSSPLPLPSPKRPPPMRLPCSDSEPRTTAWSTTCSGQRFPSSQRDCRIWRSYSPR